MVPSRQKVAWRWVKRSLGLSLVWLFSQLPLRWGRALARRIGALVWLFPIKPKRIALDSLAVVYGSASAPERASLARRMLAHSAELAVDTAWAMHSETRLRALVELPPLAQDTIDLARRDSQDRGVLFVAAHQGNWELLAQRLAVQGYPCATIAGQSKDPKFTAWLDALRRRFGLKTLWKGTENLGLLMLRELRRNAMLGFLIDQDTSVPSIFVPFFGRLAKTPRAVGDLAERLGCPVLYGSCLRTGYGYTVNIERLATAGLNAEDITTLATRRIEVDVRAYPDQWMWLHPRWKSPAPPVIDGEKAEPRQ